MILDSKWVFVVSLYVLRLSYEGVAIVVLSIYMVMLERYNTRIKGCYVGLRWIMDCYVDD